MDIFIPITSERPESEWETFAAELKASGASRVFLALTRLPFADGELRRSMLESVKKQIAFFEAKGFEVGVWTMSIGFGGVTVAYNKKSAEGLTRIRSIMGRELDDALCPLDKNFTKYMKATIRDIALTGAKMIMLDDELCLSVRPGIGCACELHLNEYEKRIGEQLTLEDIRNKVFVGEPSRYRDVWLDLMGDTLRDFCRALREAVDSVDPNIRMGFCSGYTSWDLEGVSPIELTKILAGNTKPFLRFTGAPYWTPKARFGKQTLATVIETARMQYAWCNDSGVEVFTESDTYPRDRFHTPAAYSELFHLATLASDNMPVLKYMYDYACEPAYDKGYIAAHTRNLPLINEVSEVFCNKKAVGVRVYEEQRKLQGASLKKTPIESHADEKILMKNYAFSSAQMLLTPHAIPTVYEGEGTFGIAFGENAKYLPENVFSKGLILDIKAALILKEKGIDVGIESAEPKSGTFIELFDGKYPDTDLFDTSEIYSVKLKEGATVLSRAWLNEPLSKDVTPLSYLYENADGARFLVFAFDAEAQTDSSSLYWSYARGYQIADCAKWLGGESLPAVCLDRPHLYSIVKSDGATISAAYFNINPDEIFDAEVVFSNKVKNAEFINCQGKLVSNNKAVIDYVKPFGFAAVTVELN